MMGELERKEWVEVIRQAIAEHPPITASTKVALSTRDWIRILLGIVALIAGMYVPYRLEFASIRSTVSHLRSNVNQLSDAVVRLDSTLDKIHTGEIQQIRETLAKGILPNAERRLRELEGLQIKARLEQIERELRKE